MFTTLFVSAVAMAAASPDTQIALAPPEEAGPPQRCDPRPCLRPQPKRASAYEGQFSVYDPPQIQCRVAPCPQAGRIVTLPDGRSVRVDRIAYAQGTAKTVKLAFDSTRRRIMFNGKLWITLDNKVAILAPRTAAYAWTRPRTDPHGRAR